MTEHRRFRLGRFVPFLFIAGLLILVQSAAAQTPDPVTMTVNTTPTTATLKQTEVEVQIKLQGNASVCPPVTTQRSLDAVLLLDNSNSMSGARIESAKEAAQIFVNTLSLDIAPEKGGDRVGLVIFSDRAFELSGLTQNRNTLQQMIQAIQPDSGTNIADGIQGATNSLNGAGSPGQKAARAIVLLSDGEDPNHPVAEAADAAKRMGIRIVTIRLGNSVSGDILRNIASAPTDYYEAPKPSDLAAIYRRIADTIQPTTAASNVVLNYRYDNIRFELIADSIKPAPASIQGNVVRW